MKDFSIGEFVGNLATMSLEVHEAEHRALEQACRIVEKEAKAELGVYQDGAPPFAAWAELAQSTKDQRVALGYTENDPGRRSGEMAESIEHTVLEHEGHVGSNDEKMEWFELGTSKQPPRSALGGALVRKTDEVVEIIGRDMVAALIGQGVHEGRLELGRNEQAE